MTGVCALIPAAGRGARFGSAQNKVLAPLRARPLLGWTLAAFAQCAAVDTIVLIGSDEDLPRLRGIGAAWGGGKVQRVVRGGADRQASVAAGLGAAAAEFVVVHDAARPCVTPNLVAATVASARNHGAATAAVPVSDTLLRQSGAGQAQAFAGENVARDGLWAVQTPQAFRRDLLVEAHRQAESDNLRGTDDAGLVRRLLDRPVALVAASPENLKVTRSEDLALAEAILARREQAPSPSPDPASSPGASLRIGYGYDVHPFARDRRLFLGGVEFDGGGRGLLGHSDADVLLHAVCDALLGAAGMGDIGKLFPNTDPAHKDRPSLDFLREVAARLAGEGYRVANVDITVLAEAPKIAPHAAAIKNNIAAALGIDAGRVGVKATTGEGLGFIGRGEGVAAHAVALIYQ